MTACVLLVRWADTVAAPTRTLLDVAQRFSPRVAWVESHALAIDLHGLARLFGEPRAIGEELRRALARAGLETHLAIAATRTAARLLAHACAGLTVIPPGGEAAALAPLPMALLPCVLDDGAPIDRPAAAPRAPARFYRTSPVQEIVRPRRRRPHTPVSDRLATFRRWGLRTLGDLAALPPAELAARLGVEGPALQALARGEDPAPMVPLVEDERFEATLALEWPIDGLEPLSFVLGRLCEPLCAHLDRRGRAAAVLSLDLRLVTRDAWTRRLELPAPMKDPRTFRTLLLLDLESHPPPAAIDVVTLRVDPTPARTVQHSLLERARPRPEQVSTLVARLSALMGARRVGCPVLEDSHRPDAVTMAIFTGEDARTRHDGTHNHGSTTARRHEGHVSGARSPESGVRSLESIPSLRPVLRRYRPPVPARVDVADGRPAHLRALRPGVAGGSIDAAAGPWRSSGEWWALDAAWDRDEWDVALAGGTLCRLVRDRLKDRWYVEGVYD
jgi:protein ImuB